MPPILLTRFSGLFVLKKIVKFFRRINDYYNQVDFILFLYIPSYGLRCENEKDFVFNLCLYGFVCGCDSLHRVF